MHRRLHRRALVLVVLALIAQASTIAVSQSAQAATPEFSQITVTASDFNTSAPLTDYTFIVNVDNAHYAQDKPEARPGVAPMESNSPIVAEGDSTVEHRTVKLLSDPDQCKARWHVEACRYLISIRSPEHKMWGQLITAKGDATVDIAMRPYKDSAHPDGLPLGKIRVFAFNDNAWTNGAPDTEERGLAGFHVTVEEQTDSLVSVDYFNKPLCGGDCVTAADGFVELNNLGPATYFVYVTPPDTPCNRDDDQSRWTQTTTIDGGLGLQAGVEENSDGTGAPGEQLWEPPNHRTAYWYGFVCNHVDFAANGTGTITGRAVNWEGWPPFDTLINQQDEPVRFPYVALSDSSTDRNVYVGRGDEDGNFDIENVPAGTYTLAIWDEQLSYIMRFVPVTVAAGQSIDLSATQADTEGNPGVGVSRWFGWLSGDVYWDEGITADKVPIPDSDSLVPGKPAARNGVRDCLGKHSPAEPGIDQSTCEPTIPNTDVDQRWRDGSIKEDTVTDPNGHYEYPQAEGGPLGKWFIGEVGFTRFGTSGASLHDEHDPAKVAPVPSDQGGGLLTNQLLTEGHRAQVDWGKYHYGPNEPGQIVGITYFATTRNEFNARFSAHENYEAAIPDVTVRLEGLGPDGTPNTADDPILNEYVTDHWQHPSTANGQSCDVKDFAGNDISGQVNPQVGPKCLEVPLNGEETKDGAFDGGYAFADYCPNGYDEAAPDPDLYPCWADTDPGHPGGHVAPEPLVPGTYITHVVMPTNPDDTRTCNPDNGGVTKYVTGPYGSESGAQLGCLYRPEREEDVNVDLGAEYAPQPAIPPPTCTGDDHLIDQSTLTNRSPYFGQPGAHAPLCDKRLVVLQANQNANADFFMMTNFKNGPDVEEPGRVIGLVSDDIYFDRDPQSIWYGEPRPIGNLPVGIRDFDGRLITTINTDENGAYEALLPSTESFNCPIPQGPCPGMYIAVVNDPGDKAHPNLNFNPNYLTASTAFEIWPGLTDQLDTPLDPISGTGCDLPIVNNANTPELLQVSRPYVRSTDTSQTSRRITIDGDHFGNTPGTVSLTDPRGAGQSRTLGPGSGTTLANGGIVSWSDRRIVIQVPATSASFPPGQKQLSIKRTGTNGLSTTNGITIHVMGSAAGAFPAYQPIVRTVPPQDVAGTTHPIQDAINSAGSNDLLVLSPGTYHENVLFWKRVKLQGLGPGGIVGAPETEIQAQPEDPRFAVKGTVIDGRFFNDDTTAWDHALTLAGSVAGVDAAHPVLNGADITVVAKTTNAYDVNANTDPGKFTAVRIDGIGLTTGHGQGAGGVQLQAYANNAQITNDVLESNGGVFGGGIGIGQPGGGGAPWNTHNENVRVAYSRLIGNGGLTSSGGIGIFYGSNNYEIDHDIVCSNFGVEYGAGISHYGRSVNGFIHDNQIYYNDAVDSGAGITISQEQPLGSPAVNPCGTNTTPACGSGPVKIARNLIEANYSGDDGGGIFVQNALDERVDIDSNMIVDNGAADLGGAVMLDDSTNVSFVNNTVANNVTTGSSESSDGLAHAAGLTSEANDPVYQPKLRLNSKFSNPVALFNNIFWDNEAFTLDRPGPGATLVSHGFIDFEVHGVVVPSGPLPTFTPRYSLLTNGTELSTNGQVRNVPGGQANIIGQDPLFVNPFTLELTVAGSRLDPQVAAVTITGQDPPVGLAGDYHITAASPAVDRGAKCSNTSVTPSIFNLLIPCMNGGIQAPTRTPSATNPLGGDYDGQYRPQLVNPFRFRTPWDLGADERTGVQLTVFP